MELKKFDSKIELVNDGHLSLFFTGAGSAFTNQYFQTNLLVVKGNTHILIDCGTICPFIFSFKYHTKISSIKNILLTHPHADHIGGVVEVAFISRYSSKEKVIIVITDEFKKLLWNESLKGGLQYSEDGVLGFDDYFNQIKPKVYKKRPFPMYEIQMGELNIKLFRTMHVTSKPDSYKKAQISYGMIFDDKILFTADTQFKPEQLEWILDNFDIEAIFHDCDVRGKSQRVHASYEQLKTLDPAIKQKMFLCHYDSASKQVDPATDGFRAFVQLGQYYIF